MGNKRKSISNKETGTKTGKSYKSKSKERKIKTREECEKQISEKINEILEIVKEYNPDNTYLSISVLNSGKIVQFWNENWAKDIEHQISYYNNREKEECQQESILIGRRNTLLK